MQASRRGFVFLSLLSVSWPGLRAVAEEKDFFLYTGTYTGFKYISHGNPTGQSHSEGMYVSKFHAANGELTPADLAAKINNPSYLAVSPDRRFLYAYLMNELTDVVTVFSWDSAQGKLTSLQDISTELPDYVGTNHTAEIAISPNGRFLYQSNRRLGKDDFRGPDTIEVFAIDPAKGTLALVEHAQTGGIMPRNFAIDPTGSYLTCCQSSFKQCGHFSHERQYRQACQDRQTDNGRNAGMLAVRAGSLTGEFRREFSECSVALT